MGRVAGDGNYLFPSCRQFVAFYIIQDVQLLFGIVATGRIYVARQFVFCTRAK
jgi:hypothetical protein